VSAPASEEGAFRSLARHTLGQASQELNAMPVGPMPTDEFHARSAKSQAIATIAVAQALIEIGDVLRAAFKGSADE
jgi:hypothetical protein